MKRGKGGVLCREFEREMFKFEREEGVFYVF